MVVEVNMSTIQRRLLSFLRSHRVMTVAVADGHGQPHAAALFYAVGENLRLYVLTDPATRHGRAMLLEGRVAGTVQRDRQDWRKIRGVQLRGRCWLLKGAARDRAWRQLVRRFPFLNRGNVELRLALEKTALWAVEPDWLRLIDNRRGLGHKQEWARRRRPIK
jgi:uncharacterized protein YhbP (UPF0306 family)